MRGTVQDMPYPFCLTQRSSHPLCIWFCDIYVIELAIKAVSSVALDGHDHP